MSDSAFSVVTPSGRSRQIAATLVIVYALVTMIPLAWVFLTGFKSGPDSISYPPKVFFQPTLEGYCNLFTSRSRQTEGYLDSLPPATSVCDQIARERSMVIVGPSKYWPRLI
jgi:multiple sugar transport system permease protein